MGTGDRGRGRGHGSLFSPDTTEEARAILVRRMREMTAEQKSRQVWMLTRMTRELSLQGLRCRYPAASAEELRWRFAALLYGGQTARGMYGWSPGAEGETK